MDKIELLVLLRLLSALESWSLSQGKPMPDYLHESLCQSITALEREILKEPTP